MIIFWLFELQFLASQVTKKKMLKMPSKGRDYDRSNIHIGNIYLTPGNVFPNKHSVSNFWLWSCLAVDSSIGHATFAQIMKIIFGIFLEVLAFLKAVQNHTWNCNLEQSSFWSCHCVWRALSHKTLCLFERRNMTTSSQHANHVLQYQCCA